MKMLERVLVRGAALMGLSVVVDLCLVASKMGKYTVSMFLLQIFFCNVSAFLWTASDEE